MSTRKQIAYDQLKHPKSHLLALPYSHEKRLKSFKFKISKKILDHSANEVRDV